MQASPSRRYRIVSVLGSGGFGTVYRAELITGAGLRREVALKVLNERAAADDQAAARLRDEARILSSLNHVGIVRVDDLLQLEGRWTMVMELVEGVDLDRLLETYGPLPPAVALELVESVARTLHAVSSATGPDGQVLGLVHRDIKPANILITTTGSTKLLDFGVARAQLSEREASTQGAVVMGSLPYLAPERFGFEDLPAGDVYALGALLYECLVGQRLGRTRPSNNGHQEHLREALHKAWDLIVPDYREPLLQLIARCLAFDPKARPAARSLATQCSELRRKVPGPSLADWADGNVPELLKQPRDHAADNLCGRTLSESNITPGAAEDPAPAPVVTPQASAAPEVPAPEPAPAPVEEKPTVGEPPPPVVSRAPTPIQVDLDDPPTADVADPAPPLPPQSPLRQPWGLALAASLGLLFGVALWFLWTPEPQTTAEPEAHPFTQGGLGEDLLPPLEDSAPPEPEATPTPATPKTTPAPTPAPAPAPTPTPTPVTPTPTPAPSEWPPPTPPPPAQTAGGKGGKGGKTTITIKGDAEFVQLVSSEGTAKPGTVKPGTYTLFPSFPGGYRVRGPTVTLAEGDRVTFVCESASRACVQQ